MLQVPNLARCTKRHCTELSVYEYCGQGPGGHRSEQQPTNHAKSLSHSTPSSLESTSEKILTNFGGAQLFDAEIVDDFLKLCAASGVPVQGSMRGLLRQDFADTSFEPFAQSRGLEHLPTNLGPVTTGAP